MRHHNANRKFGLKTDQRRALLRSLAGGLIKEGKITTTEAKAKELRGFIEPIVTLARKNTLSSRRMVISKLGGEVFAHELVGKIAPKYTDRPGGYTRITKLPRRKSDGSAMAVIEFV